MSLARSRRAFLKQTATVAAVGLTSAITSGAEAIMKYPICVTCGSQFAASERDPDHCPICEDERQYVGHQGQTWTTLEDYRKTHKNAFAQEEHDLHTIHPQPRAGIGQRAFLVRTTQGNLLWDCVPPLDAQTIESVKKLGWLVSPFPTPITIARWWNGAMLSGKSRSISTSLILIG